MKAIVVGGGFVGVSCALNLQLQGWQTTLIDPGNNEAAASFGNAGHLATEQVDPLASRANVLSLPKRLFSRGGPVAFPIRDMGQWLPFGLRLLKAIKPSRFVRGQEALGRLLADAMPAWHRLAARAGRPELVAESGHFVAWESAATGVAGISAWEKANIGTSSFAQATSDEMARLAERFNGKPKHALRFEKTGQIKDLQALRDAVKASLVSIGGSFLATSVRSLQIKGEKAQLITTAQASPIDSDIIVLAAGVHSKGLLEPSHGLIPLIAERGYHLDFPVSENVSAIPPVAFEDRSIIVTHFRHSVRIAGFTEFSRIASPPDERKWARLGENALELGLGAPEQARRWMGCRPTLPDYLPAIGKSSKASNLIYAFGHQHLGVTLAATTGELVARLAQANLSPEDQALVSSLSLSRFH